MELMSNFKLDIKRFEEKFDVNFEEYFSDALDELQPMVHEKLLEISPERIECSPTGTLLIRT
jgi:oxygen-independent coproporphyrinogen-3 oxidase